MTCCLEILLPEGLVLASDSRSNAGVDQVALVKRRALFEVPGQRVVDWMALRKHCADGLSGLVTNIPPPPNLA